MIHKLIILTGLLLAAPLLVGQSCISQDSNQNEEERVVPEEQQAVPKASSLVTPTFSLDGGVFTVSLRVTIDCWYCSSYGYTIRYTTDGSMPSQTNGTVIESGSAVNITSTTTLKASAYKSGMIDSEVASATFTKISVGPALTLDLGDGVTLEMVQIPADTFQMGDLSGIGHDDERPVHTVTISQGFYMGKFEVTQAQWRAIMGTNPSEFTGNDLPVEQVSWNYCQTFCQKVSARTGRSIRLPTEAEWEYACRAGTKTDYYYGNYIWQRGDYAWYSGNSNDMTHPVGLKYPNAWGLYDMTGNVWEWCNDWYGDYSGDPQTDPTGPSTGDYRVYRGGGWNSDSEPAFLHEPSDCRAAKRIDTWVYRPNEQSSRIGLRLVTGSIIDANGTVGADGVYAFDTSGAVTDGEELPVFGNEDTIRQSVTLPAGTTSAMDMSFYRPDGVRWSAPSPTSLARDGGTRFEQVVPVQSLPCTGVWTTVVTLNGKVIGGSEFRVDRTLNQSSDILVVNADRDSPLLAVGSDASGRVRYYLGTRMTDGTPDSIKTVFEVPKSGQYTAYHFDDNRNFVGLSMAGGSFLTWTSTGGGTYRVTAGRQGQVEWTRDIVPSGGASNSAPGSFEGGSIDDSVNKLYYISMKDAAGFSSSQHGAAVAELMSLLGSPDAQGAGTLPVYVRTLNTLVQRDASGNPSFSYVVPDHGLGSPYAATDFGRVGDELMELSRSFSASVAGGVLEVAFGSNLLTAAPSEAVLGFLKKLVVDNAVDAGANVAVEYAAGRLIGRFGREIGWDAKQIDAAVASTMNIVDKAKTGAEIGAALNNMVNAVGQILGSSKPSSAAQGESASRAIGEGVTQTVKSTFRGSSNTVGSSMPQVGRCESIRKRLAEARQRREQCSDDWNICVDQCIWADRGDCGGSGTDPRPGIECDRQEQECIDQCDGTWDGCAPDTNAIQQELDACEAMYGPNE